MDAQNLVQNVDTKTKSISGSKRVIFLILLTIVGDVDSLTAENGLHSTKETETTC